MCIVQNVMAGKIVVWDGSCVKKNNGSFLADMND